MIGKATQCVHSGESSSRAQGVTPAIETSTAFQFLNDGDDVIYPRYFNVPTQEIVASRIAALENGECGLVLSSGMAAVSSVILGLLDQGDHAVFHSGIYGGSVDFVSNRMPRLGIEHSMASEGTVESFERQLKPHTKMIYFESPTNPLLEIVDIRKVATLARNCGILTVIDNTFATPVLQNPLDFGIDVVLHSGTKYLNGHSDVNCGAIVTTAALMKQIRGCAVQLGGTLDVRGCYLLERGLRTLAIRVDRQCENASRLAEALGAHPRIRQLHYPGRPEHPGHETAKSQMRGFGAIVTVEFDTGAEEAKQIVSRLKLVTPAVSLGGLETLICFPRDTSHAKMSAEQRQAAGISDSHVRISVGVEDIEDLIADFRQALDA